METLLKMDDLGVSPFLETPISKNLHKIPKHHCLVSNHMSFSLWNHYSCNGKPITSTLFHQDVFLPHLPSAIFCNSCLATCVRILWPMKDWFLWESWSFSHPIEKKREFVGININMVQNIFKKWYREKCRTNCSLSWHCMKGKVSCDLGVLSRRYNCFPTKLIKPIKQNSQAWLQACK